MGEIDYGCCFHSFIFYSRGLRQGDPLSPFLFVFCDKGLSSMINAAEERGELRGAIVTRGGTSVTHLMFADGCILFCKASVREWMKIKEILEVYEAASGQCLNNQKTSIFFNGNTKSEVKRQLIEVVGARLCRDSKRYLGVPTLVGRSKYNAFRWIKKRICQRLSSWKNQFLTQARKDVLLKVVI